LGVNKKELKAEIMGDIRLLRDSIIHHAGVAKKRTERCVLLRWFKSGEEVFIDNIKFEIIIKLIREMIEEIRQRVNEAANANVK